MGEAGYPSGPARVVRRPAAGPLAHDPVQVVHHARVLVGDVVALARVLALVEQVEARRLVARPHRPAARADVERVAVAAERVLALGRPLAVEQRRQVHAVHALGRGHAHHRQQRRGQVVGRGVVAADLAGLAVARVDDHQRDAGQRRVQRGRDLARPAVLAEQDAVVGDQGDDRLVLQVQLVHAVEQDAEPAVGHRHLAGVEVAQAADDRAALAGLSQLSTLP